MFDMLWLLTAKAPYPTTSIHEKLPYLPTSTSIGIIISIITLADAFVVSLFVSAVLLVLLLLVDDIAEVHLSLLWIQHHSYEFQ
jgi:hypothetical protein